VFENVTIRSISNLWYLRHSTFNINYTQKHMQNENLTPVLLNDTLPFSSGQFNSTEKSHTCNLNAINFRQIA